MPDAIVLFFLLGLAARLVRSELRLPDGLYDMLSFYLLLAIGLKGGVELSRQPIGDRLVRPGINGEEQIALFYLAPFLEVDLVQIARHARPHFHALGRSEPPGELVPLRECL